MLVLTRKSTESIRIGEDIVVKVIRTGKSTVKIGIEAPDHVRVLRAELCEEPVPAPSTKAVDFDRQAGREQVSCHFSDQFPHAV